MLPTNQPFIMNQETTQKKSFKRVINICAGALLLYELIMIVLSIDDLLAKLIYHYARFGTNPFLEDAYNKIIEQLQTSGTSYLFSILLGIPFLFLLFQEFHIKDKLLLSRKRMSFKAFAGILIVFMSAQGIFTMLGYGIEAGFNQFGLSILSQIESATSNSTTVSMFLYASLLGPLSEELIFRGFILKSLERYGKLFAIITSALLFGLYHGNLLQNFFAFNVGLVLGFVAVEYSLLWSIALHIFNNFIFGDLMSFLMKNLNETIQNYIYYGFEIFFFLTAVVLLVRKRTAIRDYIRNHKTERGYYRYAFTSLGMIIFVLLQLLLSMIGIERI